jgi:hypothetical protein
MLLLGFSETILGMAFPFSICYNSNTYQGVLKTVVVTFAAEELVLYELFCGLQSRF